MANASVVCTNKTSTLTQNMMSVVAGSVGIHCWFVQHLLENEGRQNVDRVAEDQEMIPFSSEHKAMGVVVRVPSGGYRLYLKGASEIITKLCTRHVIVRRPGSPTSSDANTIETAEITELEENISHTIIFYANQMLRTIAVAYHDIESWPPAGHTGTMDEVPYEMIAGELTLVAITGVEDPLRPGVKEAVAKCCGAGVTIKMCTGDNVLTARLIASQCGIFTAGGIIMEGPIFRCLLPQEQREIVLRLQVLVRSSPEDKWILVNTLKGLGEIVGVTGDGTNDGPALKHANVGFSMGIALQLCFRFSIIELGSKYRWNVVTHPQ
ncbi:hypothetical protein FRC11_003138 [Ceratobasidium sp. 423]|nr:hypothetical protein FRC11_003138 [Ceratobasidium sp. 423]